MKVKKPCIKIKSGNGSASIHIIEILFFLDVLLWIAVPRRGVVVLGSLLIINLFLILGIFVANKAVANICFYSTKFYWFMICGCLVTIYGMFVEDLFSGIRAGFRFIALFIPIILFDYFKHSYKKVTQKRFTNIIFFIFSAVCICQLYLYMTSSFDYARVLMSTNQEMATYAAEPWGIAFASCILSIVLLESLISGEKKIKKIILLVVCVLVVVYTKSVITTIIMFFGLICVILHSLVGKKISSKGKTQIFNFIAIICLMLFVLIIVFILRGELSGIVFKLGDKIGGTYARKLYEIGNVLNSNAVLATDLSARGDLYLISIKTALRFPFTGGYIFSGLSYSDLSGNHSELFDTFADYGIIFGLVFVYALFYNLHKQKMENGFYSYIYIITFIGIFILNPFHFFTSYFALFFMAPAIMNDWF